MMIVSGLSAVGSRLMNRYAAEECLTQGRAVTLVALILLVTTKSMAQVPVSRVEGRRQLHGVLREKRRTVKAGLSAASLQQSAHVVLEVA